MVFGLSHDTMVVAACVFVCDDGRGDDGAHYDDSFAGDVVVLPMVMYFYIV